MDPLSLIPAGPQADGLRAARRNQPITRAPSAYLPPINQQDHTKLTMKNIIITGALGHIGSRLIHSLMPG